MEPVGILAWRGLAWRYASWHANVVLTGYGQLALASANDTSLMCEMQSYHNRIIWNIAPYGTDHLHECVRACVFE